MSERRKIEEGPGEPTYTEGFLRDQAEEGNDPEYQEPGMGGLPETSGAVRDVSGSLGTKGESA